MLLTSDVSRDFQIEQQRMNELNRLNQIKQQIQQQQAKLSNQQRQFDSGGANRMAASSSFNNLGNAAGVHMATNNSSGGKSQTMPYLTQAIQNASTLQKKK